MHPLASFNEHCGTGEIHIKDYGQQSVSSHSTMATDLVFVPGRNKGSENPVLNGYRYILDKKKNDSSYWKCALYRTGCRARIVTVDKHLTSPVPDHTQHEGQHAETAVHVAKQTLKRRAAESKPVPS